MNVEWTSTLTPTHLHSAERTTGTETLVSFIVFSSIGALDVQMSVGLWTLLNFLCCISIYMLYKSL